MSDSTCGPYHTRQMPENTAGLGFWSQKVYPRPLRRLTLYGLLLMSWVAGCVSTAAHAGNGESATPIAGCSGTLPALPSGMQEITQRVVRVETTERRGSGFVVSADGFVVTAAHVLGDATRATVHLTDGSEREGVVVRSNYAADLALIRLEDRDLPCLPVAGERLHVGAEVFLIGSPGGDVLSHTVTKGIVSAWRDVEGWDVLQTDASVNLGASGGVVLDEAGAVQGVISFKAIGIGVEGLGFAIGASVLEPALGIRFAEATADDVPVQLDEPGQEDVARARIEVSARPATVGPLVSNACRRAGADISDDPFGDGQRIEIEQKGSYTLSRKGRRPPRFVFSLVKPPVKRGPIRVNGGNKDPVVAFALEDGTQVRFTASVNELNIVGRVEYVLELNVDDDFVMALATSPVQHVRLVEGGGDVTEWEVSKRQRDAYMAGFSCMVSMASGGSSAGDP